MLRRPGVVLAACVAAGCGVRAPAPIDVAALVAKRGPLEARRELEIRIAADGRDVAPRLALAALDEQLGRPTEAIEQLETVATLGGPIGIRWHDADRSRLGRLLAARGRVRVARGAATGLADLERARGFGAAVTPDELAAAHEAHALADLRHVDAEVRARGRAELATGLAALAPARTIGDPRRGVLPAATPDDRARFGLWLWERGARRAAWEELSAWHAATAEPREVALEQGYLVAARWWTPLDRPAPARAELTGAAGCGFGGCAARDVVGEAEVERAYLLAPIDGLATEPADVSALVVITLHQALRGEAAWGEALAARVDLAAFADGKQLAKLPPFARPIIARLVGREAAIPNDSATPEQRLVVAAERALAGASLAEVEPLLDHIPYSDELRAVLATHRSTSDDPATDAAVRYAQLAGAVSADRIAAIVRAARKDPAIADRLVRDAVAEAPDGAATHAVIGALFDALGDPARARVQWQAAVDASPEPAFYRGLAETCAREGDGDAALIDATTAAAAAGDPAVVWASVARVLADTGKLVHALDAARSAIDLGGPETLAPALDVAITASRGLGRDEQAEHLTLERARLGAPRQPTEDPTSARAALAAYRAYPTGGSVARLWVASRWNPRDVATRAALLDATTTEDPRRGVVIAELVELAGDRDPGVRRAAVAALR